MNEIDDLIKKIRESAKNDQLENNLIIKELMKWFVEKYSENNEIPKEDIMVFLGELGDLLVSFCMDKSYVETNKLGISDDLKGKILHIFINNGYEPIKESDAYIIDSMLSDHEGYAPCRVGNMGVHIPKDLVDDIFNNKDETIDYCIKNFLLDLNKSRLSSVYYDFNILCSEIDKKHSRK